MHVLYEDSGAFRLGSVLSEQQASLQVEALHGKRSKIKAASVLLRFKDGVPADFLQRAEAMAAEIDADFLWQCCGEGEFDFVDLAREYCGHEPSPLEAASILVKLQSAPVYFHRKGRGRFKAAPPETLKAALAGLERKRQQAEAIAAWAARLERFEMPDEIRACLPELLYRPDRNRIETKAFEQACDATGLSPAKLAQACGALGSTHAYHLGRFVFTQFPGGIGFPEVVVPEPPAGLPLAEVAAFSLDDAATTEIDDAFSLTELPEGRLRVGIHIAAPALGFGPESDVGRIARNRLSTAYMPGQKITMLPPEVIEGFTLAEGAPRAAVSLYVEVDPSSFQILAEETRIEQVPIAANLRHHEVERLNDALATGEASGDMPFARELQVLYHFACALEAARGKSGNAVERIEYSFEVEDDRVRILPRRRGAPLDKLVAELMILVNGTWGKLLDAHGVAAIYRIQGDGKVRLATVAAEHQGLGVSHYAWSSSPLRRYVDLLNQWQLVAVLRGDKPPFARKSDTLLSALRDFEATYAAYDEFQRQMEHYWCLRWLLQEEVKLARAEVVRENLVRFAEIPLYVRVPSLPEDLVPGTAVVLEIEAVDLIDSQVRCVYKRAQQEVA